MSSAVTYPVVAVVVVSSMFLLLIAIALAVFFNNKQSKVKGGQDNNVTNETEEKSRLTEAEIAAKTKEAEQKKAKQAELKQQEEKAVQERKDGIVAGTIVTGLSFEEAGAAKQAKEKQGFLVWVDVSQSFLEEEDDGIEAKTTPTTITSQLITSPSQDDSSTRVKTDISTTHMPQTRESFEDQVRKLLPTQEQIKSLRKFSGRFRSAKKQKKLRSKLPEHFVFHHFSPLFGEGSTNILFEFYKVVPEQGVNTSTAYKLEHCVGNYNYREDKFQYSRYSMQNDSSLSEYAKHYEELKTPQNTSTPRDIHRALSSIENEGKEVRVVSPQTPSSGLVTPTTKPLSKEKAKSQNTSLKGLSTQLFENDGSQDNTNVAAVIDI